MYRRLEAFDRELVATAGAPLAGIDEAGRGALAGPVVAAAVILPPGSRLLGVNDSKALREDEREGLFLEIVRTARAVGIAFSQPVTIDRNNILNATLMTMARAYHNLHTQAAVVLLDGRDHIDIPGRVVSVVGGDGKSLSIAAASVVAKVARDRVMRRLHKRHPAYNFIVNKGYGTREHLDAIRRHGMTPLHRRSYRVNAVEKMPSLF
ncbi:MAG: ribonuclease HII [Candidatus Krumholzibacteriia bacterium]